MISVFLDLKKHMKWYITSLISHIREGKHEKGQFLAAILNKLRFRGSKVIGGKKKNSTGFGFSMENGHRKCYAQNFNHIYPTQVCVRGSWNLFYFIFIFSRPLKNANTWRAGPRMSKQVSGYKSRIVNSEVRQSFNFYIIQKSCAPEAVLYA